MFLPRNQRELTGQLANSPRRSTRGSPGRRGCRGGVLVNSPLPIVLLPCCICSFLLGVAASLPSLPRPSFLSCRPGVLLLASPLPPLLIIRASLSTSPFVDDGI